MKSDSEGGGGIRKRKKEKVRGEGSRIVRAVEERC